MITRAHVSIDEPPQTPTGNTSTAAPDREALYLKITKIRSSCSNALAILEAQHSAMIDLASPVSSTNRRATPLLLLIKTAHPYSFFAISKSPPCSSNLVATQSQIHPFLEASEYKI
jgi:hypothetical protein